MSVEVGWSKNPNAKINWKGGPVSGIIVPDRTSAHSAGRGERSARPRAERAPPSTVKIIPGSHRSYAAQWFSFAAIALIIYGLAVRKRWKRSSPSHERARCTFSPMA